MNALSMIHRCAAHQDVAETFHVEGCVPRAVDVVVPTPCWPGTDPGRPDHYPLDAA